MDSFVAFINASIIQGSVLGPLFYVVAASDLQPIHADNHMLKWADDTYLLIGSSNTATLGAEFQHVKTWVSTNSLRLNPSKTRGLVIYRNNLQAKI